MAEKCDKIIRKGSEHMLELNKPYKAEEIANGLFDVSMELLEIIKKNI